MPTVGVRRSHGNSYDRRGRERTPWHGGQSIRWVTVRPFSRGPPRMEGFAGLWAFGASIHTTGVAGPLMPRRRAGKRDWDKEDSSWPRQRPADRAPRAEGRAERIAVRTEARRGRRARRAAAAAALERPNRGRLEATREATRGVEARGSARRRRRAAAGARASRRLLGSHRRRRDRHSPAEPRW
jgi:hypothetical protein